MVRSCTHCTKSISVVVPKKVTEAEEKLIRELAELQGDNPSGSGGGVGRERG